MNRSANTRKTAKQKRTSIACDQCRALKVRCIRPERKNSCVKCEKSGSQCIVSEPRKPVQSVKPRITDIHKKLNGILDILSGSKSDANPTTSKISSSELPTDREPHAFLSTPSSLAVNDLEAPGSLSTEDMNIVTNVTEAPSSREQEVFKSSATGWSTSLELSPNVLQHLLDEFRKMQCYCPFVVVASNWTVGSMMLEKPFLLLAAITSASSKYRQLQKALAKEFRQTLATRIIVSGERNLDLLQGLLVHLTWSHFYLVPRSQQAYQDLQIAISMLIDLGLDQNPDSVLETRADIFLQNPSFGSQLSDETNVSVSETRRAYLGCYYISTIISLSFGKPNNLPFTEFMLECAVTLQQKSEFNTDQSILHLVNLQRILEETRDFYQFDNATNSRSRLHTHAERLIANLEVWKSNLPVNLGHTGLIENRYHGARVRIYEMGLVYHFRSRRSLSRAKADQGSKFPPAHSTLIANLVKTVDAAKEHLDCFLVTPIEIYNSLPLEEWFRLIVAPFVLYKLSIGLSEVPEWDAQIARETVDLEKYMDILIDRLKTAHIGENFDRADNLFAMLPKILESAKASFVAARDSPATFHSRAQSHYDQAFAENESTPTNCPLSMSRRGKCPATSYLADMRTPIHGDRAACPHTPDYISAEIQSIEDDKIWNDLLTIDDDFLDSIGNIY